MGHKRTLSRLFTFACRLRNGLFAWVAHIREMVFQAGLDTAAPRLNVWANLFDVRRTSLPDGTRLYKRKLAAQRKLLEARLYARGTAFALFSSGTMSVYVGNAGCNNAFLREYHGRCLGNGEKRHSHDGGE